MFLFYLLINQVGYVNVIKWLFLSLLNDLTRSLYIDRSVCQCILILKVYVQLSLVYYKVSRWWKMVLLIQMLLNAYELVRFSPLKASLQVDL